MISLNNQTLRKPVVLLLRSSVRSSFVRQIHWGEGEGEEWCSGSSQDHSAVPVRRNRATDGGKRWPKATGPPQELEVRGAECP